MLTLSSLLLSMYLLLCIVNKKVQDSQTSPNVSIEVAKRLLSRKGCVAAGDSKDCVSDKLSTRPRSTPQWMVAFSEEAAMHTKLDIDAQEGAIFAQVGHFQILLKCRILHSEKNSMF